MNNLLSNEKINKSHQLELDIAKGIAILFMVLVHVNEVYQSSTYEGDLYNTFVEFMGSPPAAPVFMFLLGVGIVYSRRSTSNYLLKRGIHIFALGYILNFFRDFIPFNLLALIDGDASYKVEAIDSLFGIDILPFAGLTFLFFGLYKKFNLKDKFLPIAWFIFASLNLLLRDKSTGNIITDRILGLFWGTNDYSWFPFLSWIFFPIAGYLFGQVLIRCKDKKVLYKNCFIYSFVALIPLLIFAYINEIHFGSFGELYQETYYHHDIMGNIILGTFVLLWLSLLFFITSYIPNKICTHLSRWSKNINRIYCIHWLFLGYSMLILPLESFGPVGVILITIVIFIISDFLAEKLRIYQKSCKEKKANLSKA